MSFVDSASSLSQISWAKSTLFKHPIANAVLRLMGAVPVQRRQDQDQNNASEAEFAKAKEELFGTSFAELDRGNIILLFPEGKSYHDSKRMAIKHGVSSLVNSYYKKTG